jgi:hypothetical protein
VPVVPAVDHGWPVTVPQTTVCPVAAPDALPVLVELEVVPLLAAEVVAATVAVVPVAAACVAPPPLEPSHATMAGASVRSPAASASVVAREERSRVTRATISAPVGGAAPARGQDRPGMWARLTGNLEASGRDG